MTMPERIVFEKEYVNKIVVTNENIKDYKVLTAVLEQKCKVVTKKSVNRSWVYIKDAEDLRTIGGIRLNKNSIGTFYLDTIEGYPLNRDMLGVISKPTKNFISNKITINNLDALQKLFEIINDLIENDKIYKGKRN